MGVILFPNSLFLLLVSWGRGKIRGEATPSFSIAPVPGVGEWLPNNNTGSRCVNHFLKSRSTKLPNETKDLGVSPLI